MKCCLFVFFLMFFDCSMAFSWIAKIIKYMPSTSKLPKDNKNYNITSTWILNLWINTWHKVYVNEAALPARQKWNLLEVKIGFSTIYDLLESICSPKVRDFFFLIQFKTKKHIAMLMNVHYNISLFSPWLTLYYSMYQWSSDTILHMNSMLFTLLQHWVSLVGLWHTLSMEWYPVNISIC